MSSHVPGEKYILYLPPAVEDLNKLDKSLQLKIERNIVKFQTEWGPASAFSKCPDETGTEYVYQVKHKRGVMRSFSSWWSGESIHVQCVLAVYKKAEEDPYWDSITQFDQRAEQVHGRLSEWGSSDDLVDELNDLSDGECKLVQP